MQLIYIGNLIDACLWCLIGERWERWGVRR